MNKIVRSAEQWLLKAAFIPLFAIGLSVYYHIFSRDLDNLYRMAAVLAILINMLYLIVIHKLFYSRLKAFVTIKPFELKKAYLVGLVLALGILLLSQWFPSLLWTILAASFLGTITIDISRDFYMTDDFILVGNRIIEKEKIIKSTFLNDDLWCISVGNTTYSETYRIPIKGQKHIIEKALT